MVKKMVVMINITYGARCEEAKYKVAHLEDKRPLELGWYTKKDNKWHYSSVGPDFIRMLLLKPRTSTTVKRSLSDKVRRTMAVSELR